MDLKYITESKKEKQIYDNCELYRPNGEFMSFCSKDRLKWYLSNNLGEIIEGKNNAIRLKFEPKYVSSNESTSIKRENKCYVCGAINELIKFRVIPTEYKKFFPEEWKSHNSIDLLPLCKECSRYASSYTQDLKDQLCEEYDIYRDDFIDQDKTKLKQLSKKILGNRKYGVDSTKLMDKINDLVGHVVTDEELNIYANCDTSKTYKGSKSPAEYIVNQVVQQNKLKEFIRRWKDFFVDNMKPYDLPEDFFNDR